MLSWTGVDLYASQVQHRIKIAFCATDWILNNVLGEWF